jgi:anthranilate phosphoribosyltransferase
VTEPESDLATRLADGVDRVTKVLDSGAAADLLQRWIALTSSMAS